MSFERLLDRWSWKAIAHCPGRYVLADPGLKLTIEQLLGEAVAAQEFHTPKARDAVVVVSFEGGGLISYRRPDGSFCHTLNDEEGFGRKLAQLGLPA